MAVRYDTYAVPRGDLREAIREYDIKAQQFIGIQALPIVPVQKKAATVSVHTRESILKRASAKRAKGSAANRIGVDLEDLAYACEERRLEAPLPDEDRSNYASDFDAELETTDIVLHKLLMEQEIDIATLVFNTTTWTGAALYTDNKAAPWSTAASDAIGQIMAAKAKVRDMTGAEPDTLIIGAAAMDNLLKNTAILGRFPGVLVITEAMIRANLAAICGLQKLLVGKKVYDSATEGQATVIAQVWDYKYAMVAVTSEGAIGANPSVGRTMLWVAESPQNEMVDQYREEQTSSDVFRVKQYTNEKIIDKYFAHLMRIET